MNLLTIRCNVEKERGKLNCLFLNNKRHLKRFEFLSPSFFSFKKDSGEILNWHVNNIISICSLLQLDGIAIKKTERISFHGKPKNSDIFKLYLEGSLLNFAGNSGLFNRHFYKKDIVHILGDEEIFDEDIHEIIKKTKMQFDDVNITKSNVDVIKEIVLTMIAFENQLS